MRHWRDCARSYYQQILGLIETGEFDDVEPSEVLFKRIEQHKRMTSQLIKDHGLKLTERDHFRNFASYTLKQGTLSEQDGFIRGLNTPLFVKNKIIYRRIEEG